jgi:hypothetical protein
MTVVNRVEMKALALTLWERGICFLMIGDRQRVPSLPFLFTLLEMIKRILTMMVRIIWIDYHNLMADISTF